MKNLIGVLALLSLASTQMLAQGGRGDEKKKDEQPQRGKPAEPAKGRPATQPARPEVGGGYIPARGPARTPPPAPPTQPTQPAQTPTSARTADPARAPVGVRNPTPTPVPAQPQDYTHGARHPNAPHVDARTSAWIGHDRRRDEVGLRLAQPWATGHFTGSFGPSYVYRMRGGDRRRFGFDRFFFSVADVDYEYVDGWLWDNDDLVLYEDWDHPGYYLAYNVRLGIYAHVLFIGY